MNIDKLKVCDWLAGTANPETTRVVEDDVRAGDRSETLAWLTRLTGMAETLDRLAAVGRLDRCLDPEEGSGPVADVDQEPAARLASSDELLDMLAVSRGLPSAAKLEQTGRWTLHFPVDEAGRALVRAIGERCYGDPDQSITLILHMRGVGAGSGQLEAEIEVAPPPLREALSVVVVFTTGERRTFVLDVPASARRSTRSTPCAPLPLAAAQISGGRWETALWPPTITLV